MLIYQLAGQGIFSSVLAVGLIIATLFTSYLTLNRSAHYLNFPSIDGFYEVKQANRFFTVVSGLFYCRCTLVLIWWLLIMSYGSIGLHYHIINILSILTVIISVFAKNKYKKAYKEYTSLYLKSNKGNLNALMGNPLGLSGKQQEALNSILDPNVTRIRDAEPDPLSAILSGRAAVKKEGAEETVKEFLPESEQVRKCPFCNKYVNKEYKICIYCGMAIPEDKKNNLAGFNNNTAANNTETPFQPSAQQNAQSVHSFNQTRESAAAIETEKTKSSSVSPTLTAAPKAETKRCPHCGVSNSEKNKFCTFCGKAM